MTGRKLFKRILRGYIAVALVFTVLLGACAYVGVYMNARSDFGEKTQNTLAQIAKKTDLRLNMFSKAASRLANDKAVAAFAALDGGENFSEIQSVIENNSQGLSEQGINIYISKLKTSFDKIIGANQTIGAYDFLKLYSTGTTSSEGIRRYFLNSGNVGKVFVSCSMRSSVGAGDSLLIVERKIVNHSEIYILCVFDLDFISDITTAENGSLAILNRQNMICNVGENTFQTSSKINAVLKKQASSVKPVTEIIDDTMYALTESDIYNWSYVLAIPSKPLKESAVELMFIILAICCVTMLICWGLVVLLTKWIYLPVNETVKFLMRYGGETFSDEGLFVRQSFVHIANENENLCEMLDKTVYPLRTKLLKDLMFGLASEDEIASRISELGIEDVSGPYRVVLLKFFNYDDMLDVFSKESIDKIKFQIKEFIDDQLKNQIIHGAIDIDSRTIAVISYGSEVRGLREILADMAMMVEGGFDVEVIGAIGADCDDLLNISESYSSSCAIMENRFVVGCRSAIVTEEEVNAANTDGFYYPLDLERELIAEIIRARGDEVHKILDKILEENFEKRSLARDKINAFIFALAASINRVAESINKTTEQIFGEGNIVFLDLKMCNDLSSLKDKIYELFDTLVGYINAENKLEQDNLADLMLEFIHSHYNEDISLLDIGGHFNLSQCYTSTLFKEATGENFKDYLSRYRIKMAKEILKNEPNIKNSELAGRIGCNTVATLFRLFNKYEGISPGQYIKSLRDK